jgi:DNA-binding transcriptional MerR regulator
MAKALDAFRTIGEVSEDLDVPKHVLRFWEGRFPQLKPMKRGGGRRFYRPEDVALLKGIHHLLHKSGYTIKGVQRLLKEHGAESVKLNDGEAMPRIAASPVAAPTIASKASAEGKPARGRPAKGAKANDPQAALRKVAAELEACLALLRAA